MVIEISETIANKIPNFKQTHAKSSVPARYFVIFIIFLCPLIGFAVRCVINVAILAMVKDEPESQDNSTTVFRSEIKFNWNQRDQGLILGAYFYTYTAAQIISGVLTDKLNVVHLMTFSQLIATICSFLTPIAAELSFVYLILTRMVLGLAHGTLFPSCYIIMERWLTPNEISVAQSLLAFGSNMGVVIAMPLTAYLCENGFAGGWPSAFYVGAVANIVFVAVWVIFMTPDPSTNRFVSQSEKAYIAKIKSNSQPKIKIKTNWVAMLTSLPLWSVMIARGLNGLAYYTINSKIPVYMESVLGYGIQGNGLVNSLFYLAVCSTQLISGPLSKWIINKAWTSKTHTRKIFECFALFGTGSCLLIIPNLISRPDLIVVSLVMSMFFLGAVVGGDIPIVPEMAPHLIGTAFGFANTLGCSAGFIAPAIIGAILDDQVHSQSRWNLVFYIFAGLQFFGASLFLFFAKAEAQFWGKAQETETIQEDKKVDVEKF